MEDAETAEVVRRTITEALAADAKTSEPVNALVVWTELGRALSGTLAEVGAGRGLVRKLIAAWCEEQQAARDVELSRWIYRLEKQARLGAVETGRAVHLVETRLAEALPELARAAEQGPEGRQALFRAVVKGWFPVGVQLFRSLPAARTAAAGEVFGALWAWCLKYLPLDEPGGPASLLMPAPPAK